MDENTRNRTEAFTDDASTRTDEKERKGSTRRQYLRYAGFAFGGSVVAGRASASSTESTTPSENQRNDFYNSNRAPLQETPFVQLPLGTVEAKGWLQDELVRQKNGMTSSADKLYDPISDDSGWLGGDGMGWERAPYYVKGLVPLAYLLDDDELVTKSEKWVNGVLQTQKDDGSFGPSNNFGSHWWPRMPVLYFLRDYYEATNDERIITFLTKYSHYQNEQLTKQPLSSWAVPRGGDNLDVVLWLYNRTGETFLLDLARTLKDQTTPWSKIHTRQSFAGHTHGVNVAQGLKYPPVAWQLTGDEQDRTALGKGIDYLDDQYGRIDGQFSGTESLSSKKSTTGVEFCATVEQMLSQAEGVRILGDVPLGDRLEKVAYNSMPAHLSPSMDQLSYYQLPNQVESEYESHGYAQDYYDGIMRSPHSGYPCCCFNWHMGWPKFVQNLWAGTKDNGLGAIAYGPSEVTAKVADGREVMITEETKYPFSEEIQFTISMSGHRPAKFPIQLRIPEWAENARIERHPGHSEHARGQNKHGHIEYPDAGSFHTMERPWKDGDTFTLTLPMKLRTTRWNNDSVGIERGPLAFSLKIKENWQKYRDYYEQFNSEEITPETPWNYALQLDPENPDQDITVEEASLDGSPFSPEDAPLSLTAKGKQVPEWGMKSPVEGSVLIGESHDSYRGITDSSLSLPAGESHHLKVVADGPSIKAYVDGSDQPALSIQDDSHSTGSVGARTYNSKASFTNVELRSLDGTPIQMPDPSDWTHYSDGWSYNEDMLEVDAVAGGKAVAPDLNVSDFVLEADVTASENGNAGLIFRVQDPTEQTDGYQGYYIGLNTTETPTGTVLAGESHDAYRGITDSSLSLSADESHHLKVVADGTDIEVYVDGSDQAALSIQDDSHSTGSVGARTYNSEASFTNVELHTLDGNPIQIPGPADWTRYSDGWSYNQNTLRVTPVSGGKAVAPDLDVSDFVLEADVTASENGNAGLIFRVQDPTEQTDGYHGYYVGLDTTASKKSLAEEPPEQFTMADGPAEELTLTPYGASNLRVSYFPQAGPTE